MMFILKTLISAVVIAGTSELTKKSTFWSSIPISLPWGSIFTVSWVYRDSSRSVG